MIRIIKGFSKDATRPVKISIPSRPEGNIGAALKDELDIRIDAKHNREDILKFILVEVAKHRKWDRWKENDPDVLAAEIVDKLLDGAQGM